MTTALRAAWWRRDQAGQVIETGLVHHSDVGNTRQSISRKRSRWRASPHRRIAASIGSIGDAYDNALAESTIGLFKNEAIRDDSPFRTGPLRTLGDVQWVTMSWVDWYNARRLHSTLGDVPPEEFEASYYADLNTPSHPEMAPAQERQRTKNGSLTKLNRSASLAS